MNHLPGRRHGIATFLICTCLIVLGAAPAGARTLQEAACYVFEGTEQCRKITVVDEDSCTIKVHPRPLAKLDPEIAGCLIDDVQTRKVFLGSARLDDMVVSAGAGDEAGAKPTIRISGHDVVQVLVRYDDNGAPVWEPQDSYTFELKGDAARTRMALEDLSVNICSRQAPVAGLTPSPDSPPAAGAAGGRVIDVNEAFQLASQGEIILVDVRLESEWRKTGIGVNAVPITMHQNMKSFVERLSEARGADDQKPIALICAHGTRSAYLQKQLKQYGFSGIIDVHGGMLGGPKDPGWIRSGLPVKPYNP